MPIVDVGIASLLGVSVVASLLAARNDSATVAKAILASEQQAVIAQAAETFIARNYTAFEQYFGSSASVPQVMDVAVGGLMPTVTQQVGYGLGTAGWQSLYTAGLLPAEQSAQNAYHQTYHLLVASATPTGQPVTQLHAVLVTEQGDPIPDYVDAMIARHAAPRGAYLPLVAANAKTQYGSAKWAKDYASWNGGLAAGHPAMTLDWGIGAEVGFGPVHRFSGGSDQRPQTVARTVFLAKSSVDRSNANACFCSESGYFVGSCQVPGSAAIPDTPSSPNYCGAAP